MHPSTLHKASLLLAVISFAHANNTTARQQTTVNPCDIFSNLSQITSVPLVDMNELFLGSAGFPLDTEAQIIASALSNALQPCLPVISRMLSPLARVASTEEEAAEACRRAARAKVQIGSSFGPPVDFRLKIAPEPSSVLVKNARRILRLFSKLEPAGAILETYRMAASVNSAVMNDPDKCDQACPCHRVRKGVCRVVQIRGPDGTCVPPSKAAGGACPAPNIRAKSVCRDNKPWRFAYTHTEIKFSNSLCLYQRTYCDRNEPCRHIGGRYNAEQCCLQNCSTKYCHALSRVYRARGYISPTRPNICRTDSIGLSMRIDIGNARRSCSRSCRS